MKAALPIDRFLFTLDIVFKEGGHLLYSWRRLYSQNLDAGWVGSLESKPELAEQLEAFVSRFGRTQDTLADKLLPRWLLALAEKTGSQIEMLNRAERLEVVEDVAMWLEARKLRNRLVHEHMESEQAFAEDLLLAKKYTHMLINTYNNFRKSAIENLQNDEKQLPPALIFD